MAEAKPGGNVIILTSGLVGSSVLAALLSQAGYWVGDETFHKKDYNTWENLQLVNLNKSLLEQVGFRKNYGMAFSPADARFVTERSLTLDPAPYRDFVALCQQKQPWLWKDPRLLLTLDFWRRHLDMRPIDFILISRDPMQAWVSQTLRRQIQSPADCRQYLTETRRYLAGIIRESGKPLLDLDYEDLLVKPEPTLDAINRHLSLNLTLADLERVFHGRLRHRGHGLADLARASMIYLKNYPQRYR